MLLTVLDLVPNSLNQIKIKPFRGIKWFALIDYEVAKMWVEQGGAIIKSPRLILKLYTRQEVRLLVLERDAWICHYCKEYGDTIDHIVPKARGGLTTLVNCVCACKACNQEKVAMDYEEYINQKLDSKGG